MQTVPGNEVKVGDILDCWGGAFRVTTLAPYKGPHTCIGAVSIARGTGSIVGGIGITIFGQALYQVER